MKNLKKNNKGFTIIEVLIVLAIAGLIMLVVFLAVPALQRNARNTSKRSDAAKVLGAVAEYTANNNGKIPSTTADVTALGTAANISSATTLYASIPVKKAGVTVAPSTSEVMIVSGVVCTQGVANVQSAAPTVADYTGLLTDSSARAIVALYSVEASGGQQVTQCQGS